jgi:GntR family transcriptional regulator / MocR family aminotransferase
MDVRSNVMSENQSNVAWGLLLDVDAQLPGPRHVRLAAAFRAAIRGGVLPSGTLLPPSRLLAADLGWSRWTVTEVYQQLVAEGYAHARVGSGTRVAQLSGVASEPMPFPVPAPTATGLDLAPGLPDLRAFPVDRWLGAMRAATAALPFHRFGYPVLGGEPALRRTLADYLRRVRGADAHPEEITVCTGVTDAVTRVCVAARAAGLDSVAVEDPGWTRLRDAIAATGMRVVPVPVDAQGLRVDAMAAVPGTRVAVVSPAHQFPTGVVLSPGRRAALLEWARRVDGLIVEDDYDAEFRYDRRPVGALQGADSRHVALTGSLSKTLSPALGLGWLLTPQRWTGPVRTMRQATAPGVLDQLALAEYLRSGGYDRHLRGARRRYRARRDTLLASLGSRLPGLPVAGAAAGLHLLLTDAVPEGDARGTVTRAATAGVRIACVRQYRIANRTLDTALVLGYGNLPTQEVDRAVARLAAELSTAAGAGRAAQPATSRGVAVRP